MKQADPDDLIQKAVSFDAVSVHRTLAVSSPVSGTPQAVTAVTKWVDKLTIRAATRAKLLTACKRVQSALKELSKQEISATC